ncbi:hypothetical protein [Phytohabitans rumicis]|uniref:Uncharacterized protein n=1 Tax=Phytohabitans rumicis TaxID=1076125 RepID=A0A6V8LFJ8_9ACTN|nr:hypothetical protein [Phytohabitans rumicis]GFJ92827.1 hypothetical protein Prum_064690 [Phytohabitans rumicis]
MTAAIEAPPVRKRGRTRWIAVAIIVVAATVLAVLLRGLGSGAPAKPPTLQNQLADRVAAILEQSTPAQHHDHGHGAVASEGAVLCAVKTLGFDPPGATTLAEVRIFYGNHLCAVAEPNRAWDFAVKLSGPLSVEFVEPAKIRVAEGGEGYPERVRDIIPAQYQEQAMLALVDDDDMRELRRRFDDAS